MNADSFVESYTYCYSSQVGEVTPKSSFCRATFLIVGRDCWSILRRILPDSRGPEEPKQDQYVTTV